MDLVVEGRAFVNGTLQRTRIGIEDGRIEAIGRSLRGDEHIDLGDLLVLPGAIDPHVHFRFPGQEEKEDFRTGSLAALHGGVTCVLDMPNNLRPVITSMDVREKAAMVRGRSFVDYGLFGGLSKVSDVENMAPLVAGFKLYMGSTTGRLLENDDRWIASLAQRVGRTGRVMSVHAEDDSMLKDREETDLQEHEAARPQEAEEHAIERLRAISTMARVNVCHISSEEGLAALSDLMTCEVTPHHLFLDVNCDRGAFCKVNPPLRASRHRVALMGALLSGRVDMLATDHAPHTVREKTRRFSNAPSGVPGVETGVPLLLRMVKTGELDIASFVRLVSSRAAEVFQLRGKGAIAVGADADLMVIDPKDVRRIDADRLHSRCGWTPFEGREALFPRTVFIRGEPILEDGETIGGPKGENVIRD